LERKFEYMSKWLNDIETRLKGFLVYGSKKIFDTNMASWNNSKGGYTYGKPSNTKRKKIL